MSSLFYSSLALKASYIQDTPMHLKFSLFFASIQIQWLTVMVAINNFLISNEYFVQGVMFGIDTGPRF